MANRICEHNTEYDECANIICTTGCICVRPSDPTVVPNMVTVPTWMKTLGWVHIELIVQSLQPRLLGVTYSSQEHVRALASMGGTRNMYSADPLGLLQLYNECSTT